MNKPTKININDLQFDIRVSTRAPFEEILRLKHAQVNTVKQVFKKLGIELDE